MRNKIVKVANKDILIQEKTIGELKKLANDINFDFNKLSMIELKNENLITEIFAILVDRIKVIFPQLTDEDIDNAYVSELEGLIEGFMDVNFTMLKKVFMKATNTI